MPARKKIILFGSLFAVFLGILVIGSINYFLSLREPTYENKPVSTWIAPFCKQTKTGLDAPGGPVHFEELQPVRRAVTAMGTNALPFLVARLDYRESKIHKKFRQLMDKQPIIELRLDDPRVEYIQAIRALAILGPKANPAVSNLVSLLADPVLAPHAIYALQAIGENGMQALISETTNQSSVVRIQIENVFLSYVTDASLKTNPSAANIVAAGLTHIAQDSSSFFRVPAIHRLRMFRAAASTTIPVLTNCLSDPDFSVRMAAASALRGFGYAVDVPSLLPRGPQVPKTMFAPPVTNYFRPGGRP